MGAQACSGVQAVLERKLALAWMCGRGGAHHAPTEDSALRYTVRMAVAGQLQDTCVESGLCGSWSWGKALGERGWHVAEGSGVVSVVTNAGVFSLSDTVGASLGGVSLEKKPLTVPRGWVPLEPLSNLLITIISNS